MDPPTFYDGCDSKVLKYRPCMVAHVYYAAVFGFIDVHNRYRLLRLIPMINNTKIITILTLNYAPM